MRRESRLKYRPIARCSLASGALAVALNAGVPAGQPMAKVEAAADREAGKGGVVVEEVGNCSVLALAGVRAGDIVLAWHRPANPPATKH